MCPEETDAMANSADTDQSVSYSTLFSSPGSPGRAIVLPPGVGGGGIGISKKFNFKVFYVMGKALSGELSCPSDILSL